MRLRGDKGLLTFASSRLSTVLAVADVLIGLPAQCPCFAGLCEKMKMQEKINRNNTAEAE